MAYQCKRIRELGVHGFDFHCMRYTSLTMLGESQVSINSIKSRAGHSSYETTERYIMGPLSRPLPKILRVPSDRTVLSSEAPKVELIRNLIA